jgi:hypothetical protein
MLTAQKYQQLCAVDAYWKGRWPYLSHVIRLCNRLKPKRILEIGPYTTPLYFASATLDCTSKYLKPTYLWDACNTPYPIADKFYDVVIALQVWEHLVDAQKAAFAEVKRIASCAILSFPYKCSNPRDKVHYNITDDVISAWTLQHKPKDIKQFGCRIVYYFDFSPEATKR